MMVPSTDIPKSVAGDGLMRLTDVVLAFVLLVLTAIPMLMIAMLIFLDDGRPIMFRQTRVGQGGRHFMIFKFRTMTHDRNRATGTFTGAVTTEDRQKFETTISGDPRITRIGRVLRPLHMDELPQMLNVLSGDMSLVGVRPDVPVQQADYSPQEWVDRHVLRPGITGLAQIDGTVDSMAARTARDLQWVQTRSFGLYLSILFRTFGKVLKRNSL
ncbi:sugar transferase [Fuscovulum ytuae]|uniref:Sugar transferase n=1 Tax=Fuscovulum ytuae TaxID=3042299 RepID=A0ABY8Q5F2_9RHOB|nr:sugar transferase [Fuscovulum sp. YMD61]WGV15407.1 sugar transferase [Fuscovulum sp. YMD61]